MTKRVAVLVRERLEEGLRVAVGQTLAGNAVEVYLVDCAAPRTGAAGVYLDALRELGAPLASTCVVDAGCEQLAVAELARRLLQCDHILGY